MDLKQMKAEIEEDIQLLKILWMQLDMLERTRSRDITQPKLLPSGHTHKQLLPVKKPVQSAIEA